MDEQKTCKRCQESKPLPEFQWHAGRHAYLDICKACMGKKASEGMRKSKEGTGSVIVPPVPEVVPRNDFTLPMPSERVAIREGQAIMPGMPTSAYPIRDLVKWLNDRSERGSQARVMAELELTFLMECDHRPKGTKGHDIVAMDFYGNRYFIDVTISKTEYDRKVSEVKSGPKGEFCTDVILYDLDSGRIAEAHGKVTRQKFSMSPNGI